MASLLAHTPLLVELRGKVHFFDLELLFCINAIRELATQSLFIAHVFLFAQLAFFEGRLKALALLGARLHLLRHLIDGVFHSRKSGLVFIFLSRELLYDLFHGNTFRFKVAFFFQRGLLIVDNPVLIFEFYAKLTNAALFFLEFLIERFVFPRMLLFHLPMLLLRLVYLLVEQRALRGNSSTLRRKVFELSLVISLHSRKRRIHLVDVFPNAIFLIASDQSTPEMRFAGNQRLNFAV